MMRCQQATHRQRRTRTITVTTRTPPALLATAAVLLTIGGCTGGDTTTTAPTTAPSGRATVTAAPPSNQPAGAIKELSKVSCTKGAQGWTFSAVLTNTQQVKTDFTVLVAVAKKVGGTVVGTTQVTKTLDAGATAPLEAKDFYAGAETEADVQCVPSATRAPTP